MWKVWPPSIHLKPMDKAILMNYRCLRRKLRDIHSGRERKKWQKNTVSNSAKILFKYTTFICLCAKGGNPQGRHPLHTKSQSIPSAQTLLRTQTTSARPLVSPLLKKCSLHTSHLHPHRDACLLLLLLLFFNGIKPLFKFYRLFHSFSICSPNARHGNLPERLN